MDQREPKGSSKGAQEEPKTPKRDEVGGPGGAKNIKKYFSNSFKKTTGFYNIFEDLGVQVGAQEL